MMCCSVPLRFSAPLPVVYQSIQSFLLLLVSLPPSV